MFFFEDPVRAMKREREASKRRLREAEEYICLDDLTAFPKAREVLALDADDFMENHDPTKGWKPQVFSERFKFDHLLLPAGHTLPIPIRDRAEAHAFFGRDVQIPRITDLKSNHWDRGPWMSITPMEILTQRIGLKRTKGHVVVAGLGLGWALWKIMERKQVKKVTLVEIDQALIDVVLPRLTLPDKPLEVVCGDAWEVMPKMEADTAFVDIWKSYGGAARLGWTSYRETDTDGRAMRTRCPGIKSVWCWGEFVYKDNGSY